MALIQGDRKPHPAVYLKSLSERKGIKNEGLQLANCHVVQIMWGGEIFSLSEVAQGHTLTH